MGEQLFGVNQGKLTLVWQPHIVIESYLESSLNLFILPIMTIFSIRGIFIIFFFIYR